MDAQHRPDEQSKRKAAVTGPTAQAPRPAAGGKHHARHCPARVCRASGDATRRVPSGLSPAPGRGVSAPQLLKPLKLPCALRGRCHFPASQARGALSTFVGWRWLRVRSGRGRWGVLHPPGGSVTADKVSAFYRLPTGLPGMSFWSESRRGSAV